MPTVQTPATMVAAATALIPMVGTLNNSGDAAKQAQAFLLNGKITDALTQATNLAAQDVIDLLGSNQPLAQLQALDAKAKEQAAAIAADETKVTAAIAFATSVVQFSVAVVAGSFPTATTALTSMLTSLGIKV